MAPQNEDGPAGMNREANTSSTVDNDGHNNGGTHSKANGGAQDGNAQDRGWAYLKANIRAGRDLYDSARDLIAKYMTAGMSEGAAVNAVRAEMELCTAPHDEHWQERYNDLPHMADEWAAKNNTKPNGRGRAPHVVPIRLAFFDTFSNPVPKPWLIKNVMARGETSSWVAPPGGGKSALLGDAAVHLASSTSWRGYRIKEKCGVIYFAIERSGLVKRRFAAHRLRDNLPDNLPIAVASTVVNLMDKSCVESIVTAIKETEQHFGLGVGLVIFDTYPKSIAAGGGDEDKAKDQNIALANLRRVIDQTHIHIAGIGHTGKDESRGERGSNARLGDVDVYVQITSGDGAVRTVTVDKANDQPEERLTDFELEPFEFGLDEDGDPFRTFIVRKETPAAGASKDDLKAEHELSVNQRLALEALGEILLLYGREAPPEYLLPPRIKVVTTDEWKAELSRRQVIDPKGSNPRARFDELRKRLQAKHLIDVRDDFVWRP
jgi:hypothetical protein